MVNLPKKWITMKILNRREFLQTTLATSGLALTAWIGNLPGGNSLADEPSANHALAEITPNYTIRRGHPRIYITKERLEHIRKRCADKSGAQARYYSILKGFGDSFNPRKAKPSAYRCITLAFLYVVGKVPGFNYSKRSIEEYGKLSASMLTQLHPPKDLSYFVRNTPLLIACYDWLFSTMTPKERATVFRNFSLICDEMRAALSRPIGNQFRGTREVYAFYGLAFNGDGNHMYPDNQATAAAVDKKAKEYCDFFASWHRDQRLVVLETACKGGAYPDGTMYGEYPYPTTLWPLDAWETASTDDLYGKTSSLTGYPLFLLYQMLPYRTGVRYDNANGRIDQPGGLVRFGDYRYIGYTAAAGPRINIAQAQGVAASSRRQDLAAVFNWLIQYKGDFKVTPFGGPFSTKKRMGAGPPLVWDIIFRHGLVKAKSPGEAGLPLGFHFGSTDSGPPLEPDFPYGRPEGAGVVVMRSSWDDPDGTLLWFKASSHILSHSHRDQGSFQIYEKGWLAIDSGQYEETHHRGNYAMRTVAHNCLLVYRPGEILDEDKTDPVWYGYANDGGQRWVSYITTAAGVKDIQHYLGGITKFESVPGVYDYAHADITRSYNCVHITTEGHKPKVSLVTRSLIFLRPDQYVIIFDRVTSTEAQYPKRWLLHSVYRPELDGKETFDGIIPYSDKVPGKYEGVKLRGDKKGGISESRDSSMITIRGWNFGPSDGRLVCRTLLPEKHVTRVVGGHDLRGMRKTELAKPYKGGRTVDVENSGGFEIGDFIYLGETEKPYSKSMWGSPHWPVDDVFYRGWGKIQNIDRKANALTMVPYRFSIPHLPEGTVVVRSDHANAEAFEFMDGEYNQWPMHGEAVANAGPFTMQHGCWRVEIEPMERKKDDIFLHVMLPCDKDTLIGSRVTLGEKLKLIKKEDTIILEIEGKPRKFKLAFKPDSPDAHLTVTENGKTIVDNLLTYAAIKARTKTRKE
jgi:hypothetical protein